MSSKTPLSTDQFLHDMTARLGVGRKNADEQIANDVQGVRSALAEIQTKFRRDSTVVDGATLVQLGATFHARAKRARHNGDGLALGRFKAIAAELEAIGRRHYEGFSDTVVKLMKYDGHDYTIDRNAHVHNSGFTSSIQTGRIIQTSRY